MIKALRSQLVCVRIKHAEGISPKAKYQEKAMFVEDTTITVIRPEFTVTLSDDEFVGIITPRGGGQEFVGESKFKVRRLAPSSIRQYGLRGNEWYSIGFHKFAHIHPDTAVYYRGKRYTFKKFYKMLGKQNGK